MENLFVTCPHGFEPILRQELQALKIGSISEGFCGVFAPLSWKNVFTINYMSRVATRVLWPIANFRCRNKIDLYREVKNIPWHEFLHVEKTFAIDANVSHPNLKNSLFAALVVKDAICDFFREKVGSRPSVHTQFPDVQLNLFIQKERAILYIDTSGQPLHKRGWRESNIEATLHESLAAGLLLATGYTTDKILCDPFCGSGTFLVEAAMMATHTPAGFVRKKWGFFQLPHFDKDAWVAFRKEQDSQKIPLSKGKLFGSDRSREASESTQKSLQKLGLASAVEIHYDDISMYSPSVKPSCIITNPPYGKRLETSLAIFSSLKQFMLKRCSSPLETYVLYPESTLMEQTDLHPTSLLDFRNGGLPVHLFSCKE